MTFNIHRYSHFKWKLWSKSWQTVRLAIFSQWLVPTSKKTADTQKWKNKTKQKNLKMKEISQNTHVQAIYWSQVWGQIMKFQTSPRKTGNIFYCRILQLWNCWADPSYCFLYTLQPNPIDLLSPFPSLVWDDQSESQTWQLLQNLAVEFLYKWSIEFVGGNNHVPRIMQIFPATTWDGWGWVLFSFHFTDENVATLLRILVTSPRSFSNLEPRA